MRRQFLREDALAEARRIGRAALQGKILPAHRDTPAIDEAKAGDVVGGGKACQLAAFIPFRGAGNAALFLKTAGIEKTVNAFADGQAAFAMLGADRLGAALGAGGLAHFLYFLNFLFPAHAFLSSDFHWPEYSGCARREIGRIAGKWPSDAAGRKVRDRRVAPGDMMVDQGTFAGSQVVD